MRVYISERGGGWKREKKREVSKDLLGDLAPNVEVSAKNRQSLSVLDNDTGEGSSFSSY
jgi:hypothetical protein